MQRGRHIPESAIRRVSDAVEGQRIEELGPQAVPPHERGKVGNASCTADGAEHAPDSGELRDAEVGLPHLGHDRVEDKLRNV